MNTEKFAGVRRLMSAAAVGAVMLAGIAFDGEPSPAGTAPAVAATAARYLEYRDQLIAGKQSGAGHRRRGPINQQQENNKYQTRRSGDESPRTATPKRRSIENENDESNHDEDPEV